jgi:1-acyl-sn-glycerol-3-phosphate acyltransferase
MSHDHNESNKRRRPAARAAGAGLPETRPVAPAPGAGDVPVSSGETEASSDKSGRRVSARAAGAARAARSEQRASAGAGEPQLAPTPSSSPGGAQTFHDGERDLTGLLHDIEGADGDADARRRAADAIGRIAARLHPEAAAAAVDDVSLLGSARQLLSTDYYLRHWSRIGMRGRSDRVDDFGLDPEYEARVQPLLDVIYERYFRVQVTGVERIPADGPALLVCNHGGTLPWDGVMLKTALRHTHPDRRALRWLTDDFVFHSPFLGAWLNRIGAVRACPENAERLLERGELLAVFPEGVKGIGKSYRERYQLQRFGRGGHIKLALRMGVPLIPLAIVGAEESYPLLYKVRAFSKLLGVPFIPITPLFPWLGPFGLMPLPSRWQIEIGAPMRELDGLGVRAAEDSVVVNDLNERLRSHVHELLQRALETRGPRTFL